MDFGHFDRLFSQLTGREPYPWQRRLYVRFMGAGAGGDEALPDALDLPTGLGKTSVMALWLAARLHGAKLPRRLVYVVDRRAVVDQATEEARTLAEALDGLLDGEHGGVFRQRLGLRPPPRMLERERWLPISTLRGQYADNKRWFDDPASTAIVVGTVDMVGSRLLFGGYGVSPGMRPVHAALLGVDSLVVLDEAHLARPFEAMLQGVARLTGEDVRASESVPGLAPLRVMSLSATGRMRPDAEVFTLEAQDLEDPRTAARLDAVKQVEVAEAAPAARLAETLADMAWALRTLEDGSNRRVVVFCNSRRTAQAVEADLGKRVAKAKDGYGKNAALTALLVGERRYAERERLAESLIFKRFLATGPRSEGDPPSFLVATSAGEVGVDLDADDLVCDLVAWERMVQRFGRVNRRATPGYARIRIVPVAGDKEAEDAIDADRLKTLLAPFESAAWRTEEGWLDASPSGLRRLKAAAGTLLDKASTPEPLHPPLGRAEVDAWALTRLKTHTGRPKLEPWLRGWTDAEPQTRVVWRRWLPLRVGEASKTADLCAYLEDYARPHASETLEAPSFRVADMLRERAKALLKPGRADAGVVPEGFDPDDPDAEPPPSGSEAEAPSGAHPLHPPVMVRLSADGTVEEVYSLARLANPKTDLVRDIAYGAVVVDARLGGLDANGLLDAKMAGPPLTADADGWTLKLKETTGWKVDAGAPPSKGAKGPAGRWKPSQFQWASSERDDAWGLWVSLWRGSGGVFGDPAIALQAQGLKDHHGQAGDEASRIAQTLGLSVEHAAVLVAAAQAHDLGKDRPLWQNAMGARRDDGRPYAKTEGGGNGRALNGYRHEFGSLRQVLENPGAYLADKGVTDPDRVDLALHLIGAHHGWCRPIINASDPDQPIALSRPVAQDAALRFARLQARWGPWGLAWWEALLRAADWAASRAVNDPPHADEAAPISEAAHG